MNLSVSSPVKVVIASEADSFGNAETVIPDAPPVWSLGDVTLGTLVAATDGMSAVITPSGKLGTLVVNVSASFSGQALNGTASGTLVAGPVASIVIGISQ